jgi:hypothetical protein
LEASPAPALDGPQRHHDRLATAATRSAPGRP